MQLNIVDLGQVPYEPVSDAMHEFTQDRDDAVIDELWLLEHEKVFTQGQAGKAEHLIATGDIPVVQSDRGGQVTYHGPGQLVIYLMCDLKRLGVGPRDFVTAIETSLVDLLAEYGISAYPKADAPGVYIDEAKIASLGLRIRKGRSFHGLALNVDMDLEPFDRINPCGYQGMAMTQLKQFVPDVSLATVKKQLVECLAKQLGYTDVQYQEKSVYEQLS